MSNKARLIMGIVIGVLVSLATLVVIQMGISTLANGVALSAQLTTLLLLMGALLGAVSVALSYITGGMERTVLVMLVGVALAALTVMTGGYGNRSLLPVGIYVLAVLDGLLTARATAVLGDQTHRSSERDLRV